MELDDIRLQLLEETEKFFVGPRADNERLPRGNSPHQTYTTGILFPQNTPPEQQDDGSDETGGPDSEDRPSDSEYGTAFVQNSIGLRVEITTGCKKLRVRIDYGKYTLDGDGIWVRSSLASEMRTRDIDLAKGRGCFAIKDDRDEKEAQLSWMLYDSTAGGRRVLSVFLENPRRWAAHDTKRGRKSQANSGISYGEAAKRNNANSIFQPSITLEAVGPDRPFRAMSSESGSTQRPEDDLFDMIYKSRNVYGAGYGCAAEWDLDGEPSHVSTSLMPKFHDDIVVQSSQVDGDRLDAVDMHTLCCLETLGDHNACRQIIKESLSPVIAKYRAWIRKQKDALSMLAGGEHEVGKRNLETCEHMLSRMKDGLDLVTDGAQEDPDILKAFILANRAMLYQRLHFDFSLLNFKGGGKRPWPDVTEPGQAYWYPFQIAFMLMSVRGIASKIHPDRLAADLIWFPTGGGKTEAYLGVAAFAMILRRLRREHEDGLGVSVIMRYTLRLLTLQQFERASTLVCALECLRRKVDSGLGSEPFLLGLWVGNKLTPNSADDSESILKTLAENPYAPPEKGSPCQSNYCPWCGHRMSPRSNYRFDSNTKWTLARCTNVASSCIFTDPGFSPRKVLPLVTVDSDIYARCPSMLIATVDKFARMPFRADIACIFGRPSRRCERHGFLHGPSDNCGIQEEGTHRDGRGGSVRRVDAAFPPDLIIQDELHLIAGPLGTMVGLYETAVDYLTTVRDGDSEIKPKIITSTATVRGAKEQIRLVFNRGKTDIFPHPGVTGTDSFFWWNEKNQDGKIFAGVSFSHRSGKYTLAKLCAVLLQKIQHMLDSGVAENRIDSYWTLVGYYNSIRELGGAIRLVEDDVVSNMRFLANTVYNNRLRDLGSAESGIEEITGRKNQMEIGKIREKLEKRLPDEDVISVLLATNMISVGIDIDRLAIMVINGQPKTATEYIQAAGRVGRRQEKAPGVVFTLLNPHKPRDLSHYENFTGFHSTMQKYVEPSTLSPFSIPSYDRALHAVLISMVRLSNRYLMGRESAGNFTIHDGADVSRFIEGRFKSVEHQDEYSEPYMRFRNMLKVLNEGWEKYAKKVWDSDSTDLLYNRPYNKPDAANAPCLMVEFARSGKLKSDAFPLSTPESLRDVELQIKMEYV